MPRCVPSFGKALGPILIYDSKLSPPEVRGSLVALQQLSITAGIMISFWIDYGTNYIGGTYLFYLQPSKRDPDSCWKALGTLRKKRLGAYRWCVSFVR